MKIFIILILITQVGCIEFIGYTIGTASNVTGDLITKYIEKKKDAKNSSQETDK